MMAKRMYYTELQIIQTPFWCPVLCCAVQCEPNAGLLIHAWQNIVFSKYSTKHYQGTGSKIYGQTICKH